MAYPPAAEHPLAVEIALMARRSEPDQVLKSRYLGLRKEVMATVHKRTPGLLVRLVADELGRLAETVLTECRQWREAGEWEDHRRHMQNLRAAAQVHLFLSTTGNQIALANDSSTTRVTYVRQFSQDGD